MRHAGTESVLDARLRRLFLHTGTLWAFTLSEDLRLADVVQWPPYGAESDLIAAIDETLTSFADDHPDAVESLRGRTFARMLH
jgi:hypothetical protein